MSWLRSHESWLRHEGGIKSPLVKKLIIHHFVFISKCYSQNVPICGHLSHFAEFLVIGDIQWLDMVSDRRGLVKGGRVTRLGDWRYRYMMSLVIINTVIKTSLYFEDILHILDLPHIDHDTWDCLHWTGFFPRIKKIWAIC